ncbi:MAG: hypothetical protein GXO49_06410 [Chlorobi bacterium]|nr:hypothetical protein [Chlorobiota bacterium]
MNKKSKIISLLGLLVVAIIIGAYVLLSDKTLCKSIDVEIVDANDNLIINKEHIKKIVLHDYPNLIGSPIGDVNLSELEHKIETHPAVKNAEVYKKVNGILAIQVEQKLPIARVMPKNGKSFYLAYDGSLMPTSKIGSARVMVINGDVEFNYKNNKLTVKDTAVSKTIKEVYKIAKTISEDEFLSAQTEQIFVKRNNEYELIPTVGSHIVNLGDFSDYENKLKYLKYFYKNVLKNEGWRKYKYINLKYKNQIVCTLSDKNKKINN